MFGPKDIAEANTRFGLHCYIRMDALRFFPYLTGRAQLGQYVWHAMHSYHSVEQ